MTHPTQEELSRWAADVENGMPVSAGARLIHVRMAVESGREVHVDLSGVPENRRPSLIAEIKELVQRASHSPTVAAVDPSKTRA